MDSLLLLVDAALLAGLSVWMSVAVADNWRHPKLNEEAVAMVLRFDLMAEQYPDDYKMLAHRRIEDRRTIRFLFQSMRLAETIAAALLVLATVSLLAAAVGLLTPLFSHGFAILSTTYFVCIWMGFVIGGNYFAYWYCHQWAQSNHFMVMYWGLFVLLILLI